jgi:hypothetical protein
MDSILISIGVCIAFLLFAFVVAWADHTTSQLLRDRAAARQKAAGDKTADRKAA